MPVIGNIEPYRPLPLNRTEADAIVEHTAQPCVFTVAPGESTVLALPPGWTVQVIVGEGTSAPEPDPQFPPVTEEELDQAIVAVEGDPTPEKGWADEVLPLEVGAPAGPEAVAAFIASQQS